jgi:hypothetical protein
MKLKELDILIENTIKRILSENVSMEKVVVGMSGDVAAFLSKGKAWRDDVGLKVPEHYKSSLKQIVDDIVQYYRIDANELIAYMKSPAGMTATMNAAIKAVPNTLRSTMYYYHEHPKELEPDRKDVINNIKKTLPGLINKLG